MIHAAVKTWRFKQCREQWTKLLTSIPCSRASTSAFHSSVFEEQHSLISVVTYSFVGLANNWTFSSLLSQLPCCTSLRERTAPRSSLILYKASANSSVTKYCQRLLLFTRSKVNFPEGIMIGFGAASLQFRTNSYSYCFSPFTAPTITRCALRNTAPWTESTHCEAFKGEERHSHCAQIIFNPENRAYCCPQQRRIARKLVVHWSSITITISNVPMRGSLTL